MVKIYFSVLFLIVYLQGSLALAQGQDSIVTIEHIILEDLEVRDTLSIGGDEEAGAENELFEASVDTAGNQKYFNAVIWNSITSPEEIPAHDIYRDWNTYDIHPYKYDLTKKKDTTLIPLLDESYCGYVHPFAGAVTSNFGKRNPRYHYGIDIKLRTGDTVYNAFEGVVRIARYSPTYGNVVVVRHTNGLETLYAHLSKITAKTGTKLQAGDMVGLGGNTGRSTGSHLHFEVRYKGEPINPNDIIDFEAGTVKTDVLALNQEHFAYLKDIRAAKYHTVRRGDCLGKIARRYGTTVSRICKLNGIRSSTILRPGRKIRYS